MGGLFLFLLLSTDDVTAPTPCVRAVISTLAGSLGGFAYLLGRIQDDLDTCIPLVSLFADVSTPGAGAGLSLEQPQYVPADSLQWNALGTFRFYERR